MASAGRCKMRRTGGLQIQDLLAEECPWINIWVRKYFVGIGGNVDSMVMDPNSCYAYYKVK